MRHGHAARADQNQSRCGPRRPTANAADPPSHVPPPWKRSPQPIRWTADQFRASPIPPALPNAAGLDSRNTVLEKRQSAAYAFPTVPSRQPDSRRPVRSASCSPQEPRQKTPTQKTTWQRWIVGPWLLARSFATGQRNIEAWHSERLSRFAQFRRKTVRARAPDALGRTPLLNGMRG